jgi:hypothetical protein
MPRPSTNEYPAFYETYVKRVPEHDLLQALEQSAKELEADLSRIPAEKQDHAYAEGKWTVRRMLQHAIDTERVFAYRALCFARGERQALPGFDENAYAERAAVMHRTLTGMKDEFEAVRRANRAMFEGFTEEMLRTVGTADGKPFSVLALGYILIGHWRHHAGILRERYGVL